MNDFQHYLRLHRLAFFNTLKMIKDAPLAHFINILVVGIALSLPLEMAALIKNVQRLASSLPTEPQISLFMQQKALVGDNARIERNLKDHPQIKSFRFVSKVEALRQLEKQSGLGEVVQNLPNNPLPDAFVVIAGDANPETLDQLARQMRSWPMVEHVQLDSDWAKKLHSLIELGENAALTLGVLLGTAVVIITSNTIRMQILSRREEIQISKLIGATDDFIRRPLVYFALVQGALGALLAWGIVSLSLAEMRPAVSSLAALYNDKFMLQNLSLADAALLFVSSCGLCVLGAYLSVSRHLHEIEPGVPLRSSSRV